jgi:uncharacterized protein (DUF2147 family)
MIGIIAKIGLLTLAAAQAPAPSSIEGRWVNPSHSVIIDIAPCNENLCGMVQWATPQAQQDASRGTPHLIGTQLLTDLKANGAVWEGKLFVPDRNLHVEAKIQSESANELKVSGCEIGICKSQLWTRAEGAAHSGH